MEILPLISFFTGIISILSPCILPVIPIFVAFGLKSRALKEIISFALGFSAVFLTVTVLTGFFTSLVYSYMFYIRILAAAVLLVTGIMMLCGRSFSLSLKMPGSGDGITGSFLLGLVTSLSWAPCYGAYLISLISLLVSTRAGFDAVLNLILYCAGFTLTLVILSSAISKINIEKLISKTRYVSVIFALLVIAGALYLFWESFKVLIW